MQKLTYSIGAIIFVVCVFFLVDYALEREQKRLDLEICYWNSLGYPIDCPNCKTLH